MAENIFRMVKNLSEDVKLDLFAKITDSLKGKKTEAKDDSWKTVELLRNQTENAYEWNERIKTHEK